MIASQKPFFPRILTTWVWTFCLYKSHCSKAHQRQIQKNNATYTLENTVLNPQWQVRVMDLRYMRTCSSLSPMYEWWRESVPVLMTLTRKTCPNRQHSPASEMLTGLYYVYSRRLFFRTRRQKWSEMFERNVLQEIKSWLSLYYEAKCVRYRYPLMDSNIGCFW